MSASSSSSSSNVGDGNTRKRKRAPRVESEQTRRRKNITLAMLVRVGIVQPNTACSFTYSNREFGASIDADGHIVDAALFEFFDGAPPSTKYIERERRVAVYDLPSRWTTDCMHMALDEEDERCARAVGSSFAACRTVIPAFDKIHTSCVVDEGRTQILSLNQARDHYLRECDDGESDAAAGGSEQRPLTPPRHRTATAVDRAADAGRAGGAMLVRKLQAPTVTRRSRTARLPSAHQRHISALTMQHELRISQYEQTLRAYEDIIEELLRAVPTDAQARARAMRLLRASTTAKVDVIVGVTNNSTSTPSTPTPPSSSSSKQERQLSDGTEAYGGDAPMEARQMLGETLQKYASVQ